MSLTLRHSHVPGHPPWPAGGPTDAHRANGHHPLHPHRPASAPPPLLVLTTLRPGTGDHLHKVARLASTLGIGLRLAWWAGDPLNSMGHPIARLQQRARALRRRHALAVDVLATPVCTRTDALHLAREARLTCLADAPLADHLLAPLLRAGHGPVWVIHRAAAGSEPGAPHADGPGSVLCALRADPLDAPLLAWAGHLAREHPLRLVHVLPTALPADDPRDVVALTVFDHMQRQRRLQAHHALDTLAAPLHLRHPPHTTVLHGDVNHELQAHLARSAVGTLVVGHTRRRWWPWAGVRARPWLPLADDTLVVPLPARSLRGTLHRAWASLLAAA